jgi:response regulator RpfG family c-di-GMP phosphodiesterase
MKLPRLKISRKSQLIEFLAGAQLICLALALVCFAGWLQRKLERIVRQQIISENQLIAEQLSKFIELAHPNPVEFGDENWLALQQEIENIRLPNDGYACIAESGTGKLICHPSIRTTPGLRELVVVNTMLRVDGSESTVREAVQAASANGSRAVSGSLGVGSAVEVISVARLASLDGILLVHQSEAATRQAIAALMTPIKGIGLVVGVVLIVLSTKVSIAILRRYENRLAEINENLESLVQARTRSLMRTRDAIIFGLAKLSESRDSDTGEHLDRIRFYSTELTVSLASFDESVSPELIQTIGLASSLHDIGKVGVPDAVLLKPGKLDQDERRQIEVHPQVGEQCLGAIQERLGEDGFLSLAKEICAYHHEKWDGTGYPYGLAGEQIPLSARIVALADVYDALRASRPYKEPMSHPKAREVILAGVGTHFDPKVVEAFLRCEAVFERSCAGWSLEKSCSSQPPIPSAVSEDGLVRSAALSL